MRDVSARLNQHISHSTLLDLFEQNFKHVYQPSHEHGAHNQVAAAAAAAAASAASAASAAAATATSNTAATSGDAHGMTSIASGLRAPHLRAENATANDPKSGGSGDAAQHAAAASSHALGMQHGAPPLYAPPSLPTHMPQQSPSPHHLMQSTSIMQQQQHLAAQQQHHQHQQYAAAQAMNGGGAPAFAHLQKGAPQPPHAHMSGAYAHHAASAAYMQQQQQQPPPPYFHSGGGGSMQMPNVQVLHAQASAPSPMQMNYAAHYNYAAAAGQQQQPPQPPPHFGASQTPIGQMQPPNMMFASGGAGATPAAHFNTQKPEGGAHQMLPSHM